MRGRWVATLLAAVLTTAGTAVGTVVLTRTGEALPGTTVAGQDVGGQDREALTATVEALARDRSTGSLAVTAAGVAAEVDRGLVRVDVPATVRSLLDAGRTGYPGALVLGPLRGEGQALEPVLELDGPALTARVAELAGTVDAVADPGGFTVEGTTVTPRQPVAARDVDRSAAVDALAAALRSGADSVEVPVTVTPPATTAQDVTAVVDAATRALAAPYVLASGDASLQVTPAQLAPHLRAVASGPDLALQVDAPGVAAVVAEQAQALEVGAEEAGFTVLSTPPTVTAQGDLTWVPVPASVQVLPGRAGREVDVAASTATLAGLVLAGQATAPGPLALTVVEPRLTTAAAEGAGVRSLLGTFTTSFAAGAPRARNIQRIAALVDGTYVPPGETFSLNRAAGERTLARGFVADGAIVDGELKDEVGGGVSQFATTLFNAAFFAGLPITEHKPHSFYISRYPAGRESTVYFGQLDVKVVNDTASGLLVRTRSTAGSVTVELYGDNGGRQVSSTSGPREPRPDGGFRIAVTRMTTGGDGQGGRRVFTTTYDPVPPDRR